MLLHDALSASVLAPMRPASRPARHPRRCSPHHPCRSCGRSRRTRACASAASGTRRRPARWPPAAGTASSSTGTDRSVGGGTTQPSERAAQAMRGSAALRRSGLGWAGLRQRAVAPAWRSARGAAAREPDGTHRLGHLHRFFRACWLEARLAGVSGLAARACKVELLCACLLAHGCGQNLWPLPRGHLGPAFRIAVDTKRFSAVPKCKCPHASAHIAFPRKYS